MTSPLRSNLPSIDVLSAITITGADASTFLQGQLSNDVTQLSVNRSLLASCNSAQGRVQAIARLVQRQESILMLVATAMLEQTMLRLRKYVLRSKVVLTDARPQFAAYCPTAQQLSALGLPRPKAHEEHIEHEGSSIVRWPDPDERYLLLGPVGHASGDASEAWRLADIRAGLPQVYPQTHETFVAQMLNLDLVGGIDFKKGCYTGQEIIARAHFRGTIKRRMFRFAVESSPPPPGTRVLANGAHAGDVADAVATSEGCELLAVLALSQLDQQLVTEHAPNAELRRLELPYKVKD